MKTYNGYYIPFFNYQSNEHSNEVLSYLKLKYKDLRDYDMDKPLYKVYLCRFLNTFTGIASKTVILNNCEINNVMNGCSKCIFGCSYDGTYVLGRHKVIQMLDRTIKIKKYKDGKEYKEDRD